MDEVADPRGCFVFRASLGSHSRPTRPRGTRRRPAYLCLARLAVSSRNPKCFRDRSSARIGGYDFEFQFGFCSGRVIGPSFAEFVRHFRSLRDTGYPVFLLAGSDSNSVSSQNDGIPPGQGRSPRGRASEVGSREIPVHRTRLSTVAEMTGKAAKQEAWMTRRPARSAR